MYTNVKVIKLRRLQAGQMALSHSKLPVNDFHFWFHELLMTLKTWASGELPWASKI